MGVVARVVYYAQEKHSDEKMLITCGRVDHQCVECQEPIDAPEPHINLGYGYKSGKKGRVCIPCVKLIIRRLEEFERGE